MKFGWKSLIAMVAIGSVSACGSESAKDTPANTATAAAPSSVDAGRGSAASDTRPKFLIVGTSLTAGLGLDPESAYPALLQRKIDSAGLNVRVVNAGLSGETSAAALRRIEWLLRDSASYVMIESGANDGLRGQDVDSTKATLTAIVRRVKTVLPGAKIMIAQMESPPNLGERYTTAFRAMFPAIARDEGVTLIPFLLDRVAGIPEMNQGDGIHPNEAGAKLVADNVFRAILPILR